MVASLTTPFRARHPDVRFTILSRTSIEILAHLENLEIDAGVTYVDNEPLGRVTAVPLYHERYQLLTAADAPLGNRERVTWAEVSQVPLCLLTPDMQNRRIIDGLLRSAGGAANPTLESNSMIVLFAHVRTGRWASVMPARLAETLGLTATIRAIPIVEPEAMPSPLLEEAPLPRLVQPQAKAPRSAAGPQSCRSSKHASTSGRQRAGRRCTSSVSHASASGPSSHRLCRWK